MRKALRALVAGGLGFAVSFITACGGSSGLLSSSDASTLSSQLQQVAIDLKNGDCQAATSSLASLARSVDNLPSTVNGGLQSNLSQAIAKLQSVANQKCPASTTSSTATTTTTQTQTSTTTSTPTSTTVTTPTHTTTTTPPPPTTTATTPTGPGTTTTGPGTGGTGLGGGTNNGNANGG